MADISFLDFSPRSFEQFTQALSAAVLGPGLLIFGDGADGGREASFDGPVPYPNNAKPWGGRTVMQAKFKQRPDGDGRDASWLAHQLQGEAALFALGNRQVPDNYLLVTNIRLSGVQGAKRKGGQQKLQEAFEAHLKPIGVKNFEVWHEEKIATLLDLHPGLRSSYAGWLGNREVLSAIYRSFEARVPQFGETMNRYLQRELRSQRGTRLQQAGHVDEEVTPLESVFVDLPYALDKEGQRTLAMLHEPAELGGEGGGLLRALVAMVGLKLDPVTLNETWKGGHGPVPNRHLILGGPGQGKSTITQFLAQIMRVRLLRGEPEASLSPDIARVVEAISARLAELGIPINGVRRYPIRIDLPAFADAYTASAKSDMRMSLLDFVARSIAKVATVPTLDVAILREWLGSYPFVFMLDGLDEVPPSGARREVIAAIVEFWDEIGPRNADVIMTVTTRPQGYNDDLDPSLYMRWDMERLSIGKALTYAERVAALKLADTDRRERVLSRLAAAAESDATAALMVSPLQVAILFTLVDQRGSAPTDRWTLFHDYLSIVIRREQEKAGGGGDIIVSHETVIRRLLRRVGLLLHVEAEGDGGANAYLARERLARIANDLLTEEGYGGEELKSYADGIVTAATNRLVFLEQRTEGRIEFDVRSLQEFMAAGELMAGSDEHVRARLHTIAGRTHWQHVYRIAASKAFAEPDATKFRDSILSINRALDDSPGGRIVRRGAAASLELVIDGLAIRQPHFRRQLAVHALELLETGEDIDRRVIAALRTFGKEALEELLHHHIHAADGRQRTSAWRLLLASIDGEGSVMEEIALSWWPAETAKQLDVFATGIVPPGSSALVARFAEALRDVSPVDLRARFLPRPSRNSREDLIKHFDYLRPVLGLVPPQLEAEVLPGKEHHIEFRFIELSGEDVAVAYDAPDTQPWRLFAAVRDFVRGPTIARAAAFVDVLNDPNALRLGAEIELPWLLKALVKLVESGLSPEDLRTGLRDGEIGDKRDWEAMARRLRRSGVTGKDFSEWQKGVLIGPGIARAGLPYPSQISRSRGVERDAERVAELKDIAVATPKGVTLDALRWILGFVLWELKKPVLLTAEEWMHIFVQKDDFTLNTDWLDFLDDDAWNDAAFLSLIDAAGEADRVYLPQHPERLISRATNLIENSPREGILVLALAMVGTNGTKILELASKCEPKFRVEDMQSNAAREAVAALEFALASDDAAMPTWTLSGQDTVGAFALLGVAQVRSPTIVREKIVAQLAAAACSDELRSRAYRTIGIMLDRRRANLSDPDCWNELALPESLLARLNECA